MGITYNLGNLRRWVSLLLLFVGVALMAYVGTQYWDMHHEQQRLAAEWERQNAARHADASTQAQAQPVNDGLIRLQIPKIQLDDIVVEGTTRKDLKIGPGRITSTAYPGENGNSVITGHRDTFFRHIYELNKGDDILVRRNGEVIKYQVTGKKVVDPEDLSVLKQTGDPQLTLITCYPTYYIGPAPERLVVFSKMVEKTADSADLAKQ